MLGEAIVMRRQKGFGRCTGVIADAIVDQKQVRRGLGHDHLQERLVLYFPVKLAMFMQRKACHSVTLPPSAVYGGRALLSASVWWRTAFYGVARVAPASLHNVPWQGA